LQALDDHSRQESEAKRAAVPELAIVRELDRFVTQAAAKLLQLESVLAFQLAPDQEMLQEFVSRSELAPDLVMLLVPDASRRLALELGIHRALDVGILLELVEVKSLAPAMERAEVGLHLIFQALALAEEFLRKMK